MTNLKVIVRIRPLSQRETKLHSTSVVDVINQNTLAVTNLKVSEQNAGDSRERTRRFSFDYCFDEDVLQDQVFTVVEKEVKTAIESRYHSCVLAYGQSSSGKTHTMMGNFDEPGLIPRFCQNLFTYLEEFSLTSCGSLQCGVSYLEIYNEKVHDLLVSSEDSHHFKSNSLRIREHPRKGPYVQGLTKRTADNPATILKWLHVGNANRRVSATLTNPNSSRSHSVFTLTYGEGVQLHLIDLAGSERAGNNYQNVCTLKEGATINKSLVAFGNVISTLADHSAKALQNRRKRFVPYRDSVLTWLLKDTLGGNSKTTMIATISPSNASYNETINTLRFGQRAKRILSRPVVIDDPKERTIRELRAEILKLKEILAKIQDSKLFIHPPDLSTNLENAVNNSDSAIVKDNPVHVSTLIEQEEEESIDSVSRSVIKPTYATRETLLPVMNVTSAVKSEKRQLPKIRRTYSVETDIMNAKTSRAYGSQEVISSTSKEKPKRLSQPSLLHKRSLEKSTSLRSSLLKKSVDNLPKKVEKGVVTEEKGPQKSDLVKKPTVQPRAKIVAAVTSRLYGTSKKKEAGTETEEIKSPSEDVPKELTICTNARLRLQELTQKALKAHRRRSVETQTDLYPVMRVKEISTDVDDLRFALAEVRDIEVATMDIEMKDASVECGFETFRDGTENNNFVVTRSCGTQSETSCETQKAREQQNSAVSFTKYLQSIKEPAIEIVNPAHGGPIYTNTVNINVSHNYIGRQRLSDIASDDSLDDNNQAGSVNLPTPDIISNHNSLEHGNVNPSPEPLQASLLREKYASYETTSESSYSCQYFNSSILPMCAANCVIETNSLENLSSINITPSYGPQQQTSPQTFTHQCHYICEPHFEMAYASMGNVPPLCTSTCYQPKVLKAPERKRRYSRAVDTDEDQQIKFSPKENDRVLNALSKFMEEATDLLKNLSKAAIKFQSEQSYDVQLTVNDISALPNWNDHTTSYDFSAQATAVEEASSQTTPRACHDVSANTETPFQIPVNEYEALVKDSCDKLEEYISKIERKRPLLCTLQSTEESEDYSLNSQGTSSDYGSLPRHSIRKTSSFPSDYLKQLTLLRQHIVDSTRDSEVKLKQ
ncbi:hypothetical protein PPYR_01328 [Photinus pyralis]|uniref:Kinesin motor domain-containing protein n=2 Tax=Photinus pyralis TaxID=7054 RepID=A0A5N4B498_PHOPY|nr:kinesin heavy chain-like isoform X2 [Photinus pyralis]KAB0804358.1 hypothetical protein PPYR_01328 [Photinus pyralis]